jgi:hypothetical protein
MLGKMARPDLSTAIQTARCAGGRLHRASVLRECRKSVTIHAGLGVIWGIPANRISRIRLSDTTSRLRFACNAIGNVPAVVELGREALPTLSR